jgi:hypothetical protein
MTHLIWVIQAYDLQLLAVREVGECPSRPIEVNRRNRVSPFVRVISRTLRFKENRERLHACSKGWVVLDTVGKEVHILAVPEFREGVEHRKSDVVKRTTCAHCN